ncbi:hypothetical protein AB7M45_008537 [Bradyrhizobium elkanii]
MVLVYNGWAMAGERNADQCRRGLLMKHYCRSSVSAFGRAPPKIFAPSDRQIRLQRLPGHEDDILAFGVGADGIGRVVEGEAGTLA